MLRKTGVSGTKLAFTFATWLGMLAGMDGGICGLVYAQPPLGTKYVGLTKCAACHFQHYKDWKSSPHRSAFEILPTKYRRDAECLECHTTGFGEPLAVADRAAVNGTGVNCEACHGPGGAHAKIALSFVDELITDEGLERLRAAIVKTNPQNVCISCHVSMAHKPHPKFDHEELPAGGRSQLPAPRSRRFFQVHGRPPGS